MSKRADGVGLGVEQEIEVGQLHAGHRARTCIRMKPIIDDSVPSSAREALLRSDDCRRVDSLASGALAARTEREPGAGVRQAAASRNRRRLIAFAILEPPPATVRDASSGGRDGRLWRHAQASAGVMTCPDVIAVLIAVASIPTAAIVVLPNDASESTAAMSPPATPAPDLESMASAP